MKYNDILQSIIDGFKLIKEEDEKIGFINEKQILFLSNDESFHGKSYKEAKLIRKGQRKNIIMASSKGQMVSLLPLVFDNSIISVYAIFSKPHRLDELQKLVLESIEGILKKVDAIEDGTIKLDLDNIKPKEVKKEESNKKVDNEKKKKVLTPRLLKELVIEKDFDYIRAWLFISPFSNYNEFSSKLKTFFSTSEMEHVSDGLIVFSKVNPSESINDFIDKSNSKVLCSYRFDINYKSRILPTLKSLTYVPNPKKESGIIKFEDNEEKASIILSYLNNPYLYYQEIKTLHNLEKNPNLYKSFTTYVSTRFNFNRTCELLKVHRNTIYNRLKKIFELFHKDPDSEATYYSLYSLYILSQSIRDCFLPDITSKDVAHL